LDAFDDYCTRHDIINRSDVVNQAINIKEINKKNFNQYKTTLSHPSSFHPPWLRGG
jgi:hypothetical protein